MIALLSSDLACIAQVTGAAQRLALAVEAAMTPTRLLEIAPGKRLVVLDLNTVGLDPLETIPQLRGLEPPPAAILAFGPHVHEARLASASQAGCDAVVTRGQFSSQIEALLSRYVGTQA
jgi:CheY-like chemotaxis protein